MIEVRNNHTSVTPIRIPVGIHIVLWVFMVLFIFDYHWYEVSWITALAHSLIEVLSYAALFYLTLWLFNTTREKPFLLTLWIIIGISIYVMLLRISGLEFYFYESEGLRNVYSMILNATLFCGLAILFGISQVRTLLKQKNLELEAANKQLQLNNLKAKINPHFIFNTLNNLNALIVKKDNKLPDFVNEFSTLLRYSIDDGANHEIPLSKEVNCVKSYFRLLEMEMPLAQDLDLYIEGDLSNKKIIPYIITTLVENAIKHSDININEDGHLHIQIGSDQKSIHVQISNSFEPKEASEHSHGIKLIRDQLSLNYDDHYKLEIQQHDGKYRCELIIFSSNIQAL